MRYVVTGGAGYVGRRLVHALAERPATEAVAVLDARAPESLPAKAHFQQLDVTDASALQVAIGSIAPEAVVHLAFARFGERDADAMYQVDVGGTNGVLHACAQLGVGQVVVMSSAAAYGAYPDNPLPLTEDCPVRGAPSWHEARVRASVDRLCQLWAVRHPDRAMTIVRPATIVGPALDPMVVRMWRRRLLRCPGRERSQPLQFVHVDDVVAALVALVEGRHAGVYNVAGEGTLTLDEGAELAGVRRRLAPFAVYRAASAIASSLRLLRIPAGNIDFARYPWVVSTDRLRATGWAPSYTSRAALEAGLA